MELTGYTKVDGYEDQDGEHEDGDYVVMDEVYFDWWLGVPKSEGVDSIPATVENYMQQYTTYYEEVDGVQVERRIYLYDAVRCFRFMNPDVTTLYDPNIRFGVNPLYQNIAPFTERMLEYLRSLANPSDGSKPQLAIHTKIVDVQINDDNVYENMSWVLAKMGISKISFDDNASALYSEIKDKYPIYVTRDMTKARKCRTREVSLL